MASEAGKSNNIITDELVTNVFKELSSAGFLEQLRLECVANVKTMSTYLQLKDRFIDLLNKKLSNAEWKFEVAAPRLSILREQIVECSVLAVTIERVVDEVVSWKVREQIVSIIKEILCVVYDHKTVGKLKLDGLAKLDGGAPSFSQLEDVIKKICNHIHIDWKHVFKDETIGKSLASISVSHNSDDDGSSSEISDSDSDVEIIPDDQYKSGKNKRKIEIIVDEEETRSKRERKKNSKYFSDIYDTPVIISAPEPDKPITPDFARSSSSSESFFRGKDIMNDSFKRNIKSEKNGKSPTKSLKERNSLDKKKHKVNEIAIKSEPLRDPDFMVTPSSTKSNDESKNGFVRKSERQHKPNSRLFWEPGESPHKTRVQAAEQEAVQDLKQMELTILENELRRDLTQTFVQAKKEYSLHGHNNVSSAKSIITSKDSQKESDLKKKHISPESSTSQKYTVSELYKPRPVTNGKRGRPRKDSTQINLQK